MSVQQGPLDLRELGGSVAVVTGAANQGIGWGLAQHCASLGMAVAIVDLRDALCQRAADQLRELQPGAEAVGIGCDVSRVTVCHAPASGRLTHAANRSRTRARWPRALPRSRPPSRPLGAVFANAGVLFNKTILGSSLEDWKTTLNVNVLGVVNTIKAFVPAMQRQPNPSVVCATASVGGLVRGDGGAGSYQASKHAVVAICETLSFELAARYPQIRVHVLCPCIANSALPTTSQTNKAVERGELPEVTEPD